ncbi:MAG TPA: diaminopimelate epimerase [Actinomycetota bacterium]|nr:diaminopimelate epimerase [Actinomycetota bacterium]
MRFAKWHGLGNDFVMLRDYEGRLGAPGRLPRRAVAALCDRRTGVGADGVIRVLGPEGDGETAASGAVLRMDYYNSDGAPAEMCGNGIRCLALLASDDGRLPDGEQAVLTGAGTRTVRLADRGMVTVDMGIPALTREDVPMSGTGSAVDVGVELPGEGTLVGTGVSMGNPHFVLFVDEIGRDLDDDLVLGTGSRLETHDAFPERTNVEFVRVESPDELVMRVWERGVGETQACGTGACAVAVAAASKGRAARRTRVRLPGGDLDIHWTPEGTVLMTGPAEQVYEGDLSAGWLSSIGLDTEVTT